MSQANLHTFNASNDLVVDVIASAVSEHDGILFLENGVYLARSLDLSVFDDSIAFYVLQEDLVARGLSAIDGMTSVSYAKFVDLCTQYRKVVSW